MNRWHIHIAGLLMNLLFCHSAFSLTMDDIYKVVNAKPTDIVIVCFMTPGECVKCQIAMNAAFTWLSTKTVYKSRIKLAAVVHCNRKIEAQAFHKDNPMFLAVFPNYGKEKSNLQVSSGTRVGVYSKQTGLIGTVNEQEYFGDIQSAFKRILKIK